jgi:hypothetical protein
VGLTFFYFENKKVALINFEGSLVNFNPSIFPERNTLSKKFGHYRVDHVLAGNEFNRGVR